MENVTNQQNHFINNSINLNKTYLLVTSGRDDSSIGNIE